MPATVVIDLGCTFDSQVFRDVSVDAICALVQQSPALFLPPVISYASTATSDMGNDSARKGASSLLHRLLLTTPDPVVPYSPLLLAPLISRMSDPDPAVRRTAAAAFGRLVTLLPLAAGRGLPESLPADLKDKMDRDYRILDQLLDSKHAEDYE